MPKAVFTTKINPTYDDLPEQRYHFPKTYLRVAEATVGDWIVYYEPRRSSGEPGSRGGRQAYFASARVTHVEEDRRRPNYFYAFMADYLEFDRPVPFRDGEFFYEGGLRRADGNTSKGAFGRAVRALSDQEFHRIVTTGFLEGLEEAPSEPGPSPFGPGFAEEPPTFERPIVNRLIARPFRDEAFARHVKAVYDNTCAVTGLKLINGGGRAEVEAAHIRPVASSGPDSVRNGLALSGTVHWMFDRGLISIGDDYSILLAQDHLPEAVTRLINPDRRLRLPDAPDMRPHPQFLDFHRQQVFKG